MLIQCTKKLLDELKVKPEERKEEDPLFSWHANVISINRRKTVVIMNDKSRYMIILHGLKAKDFKNLGALILQAIRETFQRECIKDEIIDRYIDEAKSITFTKTKDRTLVARLNKSCEMAEFHEDDLSGDFLVESAVSMRASRYLVGQGKNHYVYPNEELYKDLEDFSGSRSIIRCKAAELLVTLELGKHQVWRRIVMPVNRTFRDLHQVLQTAFGWEGSHLYEFYIYDQNVNRTDININHKGFHKDGFKPTMNLVCSDEAFAFGSDIPMEMDCDIQLSEYVPVKMKYVYDFGDNWQHYIDVAKILPDFDKNYPVCLDGEGTSPPEDVGGEGGYEEFLKIMANPEHSEYEWMLEWAGNQKDREFNVEKVNRLLKAQ